MGQVIGVVVGENNIIQVIFKKVFVGNKFVFGRIVFIIGVFKVNCKLVVIYLK